MEPPQRIAIFFSGRIKGYEEPECLAHLKAIQKTYDPVFFCSLNAAEADANSKQFFAEFNLGPDQINLEVTPIPDWIEDVMREPKFWNPRNIFSMYYHNQRCMDLIKAYQKKQDVQFDGVLRYRADIVPSNGGMFPIPREPEPGVFYTPIAHDWEGINDQIAYGTPETISIYCDVVDKLHYLYRALHIIFQAESLLAAYVDLCDAESDIGFTRRALPFDYDLHRARLLAT